MNIFIRIQSVLNLNFLTCPVKPEEPTDHIGPAATFRVAPRSGNTVWVWLSPQSSECSPGTLAKIRDPDRTAEKFRTVIPMQESSNF